MGKRVSVPTLNAICPCNNGVRANRGIIVLQTNLLRYCSYADCSYKLEPCERRKWGLYPDAYMTIFEGGVSRRATLGAHRANRWSFLCSHFWMWQKIPNERSNRAIVFTQNCAEFMFVVYCIEGVVSIFPFPTPSRQRVHRWTFLHTNVLVPIEVTAATATSTFRFNGSRSFQ